MTRSGLRRFVEAPQPPPEQRSEPAERCEMCGTQVGAEHGHVVDLESRSLSCACRACYLLFTREEAGGGRYRAVPDRYLFDPDRTVDKAEWDALGIPVGSAFFLASSRAERPVSAFYPSPAGATECLLDLDAWQRIATAHPLLRAARQDVEAILIRSGDSGVEAFLVPIDACYLLVGTVRMCWQGFDGGQEATAHIEEFFAGIRARARKFDAEA